MRGKSRRKTKKPTNHITRKMKKKLVFVVCIFFVLFLSLAGVLVYINMRFGDEYTLEVLENRDYVNTTIPYKRGDILDRNNVVLATSTKVYKLILDAKLILDDSDDYMNPTLDAVAQCFGLDKTELETKITENPENQNIVILEGLTYSETEQFRAVKENTEQNPNIRGLFLREEYERKYGFSTLASDVIGFTSDNTGAVGLEAYYNEYLTGSEGREYGYVNDDNVYETIIRKAEAGDNIVTTLDSNIQTIVEKYIAEYKQTLLPKNIGVIIADPNTGEILAMASDKGYDLNNPRDLSAYYTPEEISVMNDEQTVTALNEIWSNFCVTYTYEPGSTFKPFTVAGALEEAIVTGENTYLCDGGEEVGGWHISCNNVTGHGALDLKHSITFSCNDALMQIAKAEGAENFVKYQKIFGFGKSTGIDIMVKHPQRVFYMMQIICLRRILRQTHLDRISMLL
jgi:stage V sporulation protein D (sporulation-specific penicillin-binding protein)